MFYEKKKFFSIVPRLDLRGDPSLERVPSGSGDNKGRESLRHVRH